MTTTPFPHFATQATHEGQEPEQWDALQVVPPISTASTYKQLNPADPKKYDYGRAGNPTRSSMEKCLASLENAEYCYAFASGLATTNAITSLLSAGDHIVCCNDVYGGTQRYFRTMASKNGIQTTLVDLTDHAAVADAIQESSKLLWIESPTNPLLTVCDIAALAKLAKAKNPEITIVVDNTFMTPYFQRPLALGADIVIHSITKYINGHTDVIMGCMMTNDKKIADHMFYCQLALGTAATPFDCYLVNRGVKTLHLRMEAHQANAFTVAEFLEKHSCVTKVLYPGLPSHPQHKIHKKQTSGMSGMLSFYIKGGMAESRAFLKTVKIFTLAESLGGYESLAELPAVMTHASVPADEREKLGISDSLIRLSVGIENIEDILEDLDQALKTAVQSA